MPVVLVVSQAILTTVPTGVVEPSDSILVTLNSGLEYSQTMSKMHEG